MIVVLLYFAETRTDTLATKIAIRDTNPKTTALRQLTCLITGTEFIDQWIQEKRKNGAKILLLSQSSDNLILFVDPKIGLGEPRVDIFTFSLQAGYATRDSVASAEKPFVDSSSCLG
mgnify:CR=1 FL=1